MSTPRASLLTGLRTGGPRSVSNGSYNPPQSASLAGPYIHTGLPNSAYLNLDREPSPVYGLSDGGNGAVPMTAPANDATFSPFQQQQAQLMLLQAQAQAQAVQNAIMNGTQSSNGNFPFQNGMTPEQQQAMQLQVEVLKMQAMHHQQQLQAQILQEAQRQMMMQQQQQQQQQRSPPLQNRRRPSEPMTAGPFASSFAAQAQAKARSVSAMNDGSMTASIDGRFTGSKLNPNATSFQFGSSDPSPPFPVPGRTQQQPTAPVNTPATANFGSTNVLSGGTLLGSSAPVPVALVPAAKHALATSWRRPSESARAFDADSRTPSPTESPSSTSPPPTVYVSTPEETSPVLSRESSPPAHAHLPRKPQPLRFNSPPTIMEQPHDDGLGGQVLSFGMRANDGPISPVSPSSGSSSGQNPGREEATRRMYESLGIGRPAPQAAPVAPAAPQLSQPTRQPLGPPSGVEELGTRNFAGRIRRQAIGGLGVLMNARARRTSMIEVEAY